MWIQIFKNFNFFGKNNHNSTQKSAALSIKLLSKITFFTISLFSDSSGRFWKKRINFFRNPMVYPIKIFDFSHNSTQECSAPSRKKSRKFSKKGAQFWWKLMKKMLQIWSRKFEKKSKFSFFLSNFFSKIKTFSSKKFSTMEPLSWHKRWQTISIQNIHQQNFWLQKNFLKKKSQLG